jgi:hypothetical protein
MWSSLFGDSSSDTRHDSHTCHLNPVIRDPDGRLYVVNLQGEKFRVSSRYGWSTHNCSCKGRKTGLVLYPIDIDKKNVVLLVCEECYGYRRDRNKTQHDQLLEWYYNIYGESKQYRFVSGFSLKDDGSLGFNSVSMNTTGPYATRDRHMNPLEQSAVKAVVEGKLDSYIA